MPEEQKLQPVPASLVAALPGIADTLNENVAKLNARLFTYLDYAVVGEKIGSGFKLPASSSRATGDVLRLRDSDQVL